MIKRNNLLIVFFAFAVLYLLIYRSFFSYSPLSWGDAPFFYPENLKELFNPPFTWNIRNDNFGSPQFHVLWLYLPTFFYGLFHALFGLIDVVLVRIIFYFPATILSIVGAWFFINQFTKNTYAKFLGTFLYGFNTYFLSILDGGQVGIALAYGLFPGTCFFLLKYLKVPNTSNFIFSLISLLVITNVDIRIFMLVILFTLFLSGLEANIFQQSFEIKKKSLAFIKLIIPLVFLNAFWLMPLVLNSKAGNSFSGSSMTGVINLLDALLLYQPQFPLNQFGTVLPIPFYFGFVPFLLFSGFIVIKADQVRYKYHLLFAITYLILVFFTKGGNDPFGQVYTTIIDKIPLGFAFRDSSKFFMPLILVSSCLIALSVESVLLRVKSKYLKAATVICIFGFLLILVHPAVFGQMSGALGKQKETKEFFDLAQLLKSEKDFYRTVWFDEKPPLAYSSWSNPAISANNLYKERPFATMTTGSYDLYGFLHSPQLTQWFDLLGIRYASFTENQRKKIWTTQDKVERGQFLDFIGSIQGFKQVNFNTDFPIYEVSEGKPHIFGQNKILVVVGGEGIYEHLFQSNDFELSNQGFIFLEDGKIDLQNIEGLNKTAITFVFEKDKNLDDLALIYLKDRFFGPSDSSYNEWGIRNSNEYLQWKYELLRRGVSTFDFDFGKGIAFSTIKDERMEFKVPSKADGNYFLAIRHINASDSAKLEISVADKNYELFNESSSSFKWSILGPIHLKKETSEVKVINKGGLQAVNVVSFVSESDLALARARAKSLVDNFTQFSIKNDEDYKALLVNFNSKWVSINYNMNNPTRYQAFIPQNVNWLVFSDHLDEGWRLEDEKPFAFYSMINGFYIGNLSGGENVRKVSLKYSAQEQENLWVKVSMVAGVVLVSGLLIKLVFKR